MKTYTVSTKLEKHLKRNDRFWKNIMKKKKVIGFLTVALAFFLLGIIGKSCWDGYWRTHEWKLQSPVIFQTPVIIKELKPVSEKVVSPVPEASKSASSVLADVNTAPLEAEGLSKPEIINRFNNSEIIYKIWVLETGMGENKNPYALHNTCKEKGMSNEFGYAAQCFPSFEYTVERLDLWLDRELKGRTLAQTLCYYNTGYVMNDCPYYQNYLSL